MTETLDLCLEEINRSVESISTLYFKPPGIFHNAVVGNKEGHGYSTIITQLIRDCNPKEELTLFEINPKNGTPTRKDGKETVVDYLVDRDLNLKRNRRVGLPDPKPIVNVPKEFYLKRHNEVLKSKRRKPNAAFYDIDNLRSSNDSNVFKILMSKFQDDLTVNLLQALQNGSVMMESPMEDSQNDLSSTTRRKTIFLDDFPPDLILRVLEEIAVQWPLSEYKQSYMKYAHEFSNLSTEVENLRKEVKIQENQLQTELQMNQASSHAVTKLIEKEKEDIRRMEQEILKIEEISNN